MACTNRHISENVLIRQNSPSMPLIIVFESYHSKGELSTKKYFIQREMYFPNGLLFLYHSLLRMILPEMVLGSSVRNSTILGYL